MSKSTAKASSDTALIKYWGKKNEELRIPENDSISIVLDGLDTVTTVEFDEHFTQDEVMLDEAKIGSSSVEYKRVVKQLDRLRKKAGKNGLFAKVVSKNSFPRATGLSSSGSGMAALTFAAAKALGLELTQKELSIFSRLASGTACRCAVGGFAHWMGGDTSETSFSKTIFDKNHWDIRDVIVVVSDQKKKITSTQGHKSAQSSSLFKPRQKGINQKIKDLKKYIAEKDFKKFGELVEADCLEFHSVLLTSKPPLVLWQPGTIQVINEVQQMREEGIECYFTINTGFNVHALTLPEYEAEVKKRLERLSLVKSIILAKVGGGPKILDEHLF